MLNHNAVCDLDTLLVWLTQWCFLCLLTLFHLCRSPLSTAPRTTQREHDLSAHLHTSSSVGIIYESTSEELHVFPQADRLSTQPFFFSRFLYHHSTIPKHKNDKASFWTNPNGRGSCKNQSKSLVFSYFSLLSNVS